MTMKEMMDKIQQLREDVKAAPLKVKIVTGLVILYLLSPIDLIPDFIPLLGQFDDVLLLSWLIRYVKKNK